MEIANIKDFISKMDSFNDKLLTELEEIHGNSELFMQEFYTVKIADWIGTEGGLNFANSDFSAFKKYNLPEITTKIGSNTIKSILPDGNNLWIVFS